MRNKQCPVLRGAVTSPSLGSGVRPGTPLHPWISLRSKCNSRCWKVPNPQKQRGTRRVGVGEKYFRLRMLVSDWNRTFELPSNNPTLCYLQQVQTGCEFWQGLEIKAVTYTELWLTPDMRQSHQFRHIAHLQTECANGGKQVVKCKKKLEKLHGTQLTWFCPAFPAMESEGLSGFGKSVSVWNNQKG